MPVLSILLGLVMLVVGGDMLVRGASRVALSARISPAVVGLTIVAMGTSMPELVVSLSSAYRGSPDLAVGNVVGSNIYNIGLILGVAALIRPLRITGNTVRMEWPIMMLAAFQLHLLARDGSIDRLEGAFFVTSMVVFVAWSVHVARSAVMPAEEEALAGSVPEPAGWGRSIGEIVLGAAVLSGGAQAMVWGAVEIASVLGVSERVIGLTIVAIGTSLPELFASVMASLRGNDDIAVGNVVGSNIFNIVGILGLTSLILPLPVNPAIVASDNLWMLGFSLLLLPLMRTEMTVQRWEGGLLVVLVVLYTGLLVAG